MSPSTLLLRPDISPIGFSLILLSHTLVSCFIETSLGTSWLTLRLLNSLINLRFSFGYLSLRLRLSLRLTFS